MAVGGVANPIYSVLLAYTNDFLDASDMAAASAGLLFINGVGAMTGPLITGWAMQGKGRAVWCVGEHAYKVQTVLHPLEQELTYTNDALEKAG